MKYFGTVENVLDPEHAGRVQVRVFPYYRQFAVEDLPWAYVLRSTDLGNTSGVGLNMHNLLVGSQVLVDFLDPQMQQPIVLGIVPREADFANMQSHLKHVLKFVDGAEIVVDETPDKEYIKIIDTQENYILMSSEGIELRVGDPEKKITIISDGKLEIKTEKDTNITTHGKTSIEGKGDMNIKCEGNTTIEAQKLSLKNISGTSQLCCLKNCLFTGALHQSPTSD